MKVNGGALAVDTTGVEDALQPLVNIFTKTDILVGGTLDDGADRAHHGRQAEETLV